MAKSRRLKPLKPEARRIARLFIRTYGLGSTRLDKLWHEQPRQHPGRREHIYGRVHAMNCRCIDCN
jgi:hypothetical protein